MRYSTPLAHRPGLDGTTTTARHVPFFLALEVMAGAWIRLLAETAEPVLTARDVAVVSVQAAFTHEVFVGAADCDAHLARIGSSSLVWQVQLHQGGRQVADVQTVVARADEARTRALALTPQMRDLLAPLLAAGARGAAGSE